MIFFIGVLFAIEIYLFSLIRALIVRIKELEEMSEIHTTALVSLGKEDGDFINKVKNYYKNGGCDE